MVDGEQAVLEWVKFMSRGGKIDERDHQTFELDFVLVGEIVDGRFRPFGRVGDDWSTLNHVRKDFILTLERP